MVSKISNRHLKNLVLNFIISPFFAGIVLLAGMAIEFAMNQTLYVDLFDMGLVLGTGLALAMSVIISTLSTLTAKLLDQGRYAIAVIASVLAIGFFTIIFYAYKEVEQRKTSDPFNDLLGGPTAADSNQHVLVLALVVILYAVSVLVHFLLYTDKTVQSPAIYRLLMAELGRLFRFRLFILEGVYNRLKGRPQIIAENKVRAYQDDLESKVWKLSKELKKLRGRRAFDLRKLELAKLRVDAYIDALYGDQN
ncbi:MAG: hypothetical protein R8G66_02820 [Cytophagales bacterium]|nr:hypothetical protein [Cytophagales bacterium]